jgi:hypothetical protein
VESTAIFIAERCNYPFLAFTKRVADGRESLAFDDARAKQLCQFRCLQVGEVGAYLRQVRPVDRRRVQIDTTVRFGNHLSDESIGRASRDRSSPTAGKKTIEVTPIRQIAGLMQEAVNRGVNGQHRSRSTIARPRIAVLPSSMRNNMSSLAVSVSSIVQVSPPIDTGASMTQRISRWPPESRISRSSLMSAVHTTTVFWSR